MDVIAVLFKLFMIANFAVLAAFGVVHFFGRMSDSHSHKAGVEYAATGAGLAVLASGRHLFTGLAFDNKDEFFAQTIFTLILFTVIGYIVGRMTHSNRR